VDGRQRKTLGGVGVPLGVIQHLLVGPPSGALHPGGQPFHADRLADLGHLPKPLAQVGQAGDEGAVGLAEAQGAKRAKQQVQAVTDLGLGDADHAAGAPVRQPVQQHRDDRVQADLQRQRPGTATPGRARWEQVGEAIGQPGQHGCGRDERGQYDKGGPDLLAGVSTLPMVWSPSKFGRPEHHGHPH
jgi:hypothetical protein